MAWLREAARPPPPRSAIGCWPAVARRAPLRPPEELRAYCAAGPWRVRVADRGEAALLGVWRSTSTCSRCAASGAPSATSPPSSTTRADCARAWLRPACSLRCCPSTFSARTARAGMSAPASDHRDPGHPRRMSLRPTRPAECRLRAGLAATISRRLPLLDAAVLRRVLALRAEELLGAVSARSACAVAETARGELIGYTLATVSRGAATLARLVHAPACAPTGVGRALVSEVARGRTRPVPRRSRCARRRRTPPSRALYAAAGLVEVDDALRVRHRRRRPRRGAMGTTESPSSTSFSPARSSMLSVVTIWSISRPSTSRAGSRSPGSPASSRSALALVIARFATRPDHVRALQSHKILEIANEALAYMRQGLTEESAQAVCRIVLAETEAAAVAITDTERRPRLRGRRRGPPRGRAARSSRARRASRSRHNEPRVLATKNEIGCPRKDCLLTAAIVVPLEMRGPPVGTLKFYYTTPRLLNETQIAMAEGLAHVLSTQLELSELERQTELATRMELKALQAQINPHFLFNTINTIAALIRTDPARARELLREFAAFYRRTLESGDELITARARRLEQTRRYLHVRARAVRRPHRGRGGRRAARCSRCSCRRSSCSRSSRTPSRTACVPRAPLTISLSSSTDGDGSMLHHGAR